MALRLHSLPPGLSPRDAFGRLRSLGGGGCVLLESRPRSSAGPAGGRGDGTDRFSFVAPVPFATLTAGEDDHERPLDALGRLLARWPVDPAEAARAGERLDLGRPLPFPGGACGYLAYELGATLEAVPVAPSGPADAGLLHLGFHDVVLGWDHRTGRSWLVEVEGLEGVSGSAGRVEAVLEALAADPGRDPHGSEDPQDGGSSRDFRRTWESPDVSDGSDAPGPQHAPARGAATPGATGGPRLHGVPGFRSASSTFSPRGYRDAVERIRRYIRAGDAFQVNLTQAFTAPWPADPLDLYDRLAARNPAPFSAFVEGPAGAVVSVSPERFLRVEEGRVETRPIKGTARRCPDDPAEDRRRAAALLESGKDRAENVMIVDLLRNDLSRVCRDGSVEVPELCALTTHPTVHHLVSTVTGVLRAEAGPARLLQATFPGGSITGAPKIRAMEIIAELEGTRRGVYTGSVAWIGFDGAMDASIAIRTAWVRDGAAWVSAGGGVVLDSDPEAEWRESVDKVRGILEVLEEGPGGPGAGARPPRPRQMPRAPRARPASRTGPAPGRGAVIGAIEKTDGLAPPDAAEASRMQAKSGTAGIDDAVDTHVSGDSGDRSDAADSSDSPDSPDFADSAAARLRPGTRPRVVLLDHRDSFVHTLARYLRELGARTTVLRADRTTLEEIAGLEPTHLVLSPGPCTPRESGISPEAVRRWAGRIPILGVCLGHLCIADALGGGWRAAALPTHGRSSPVHHDGRGIFTGLPSPFDAGRYHSLAVGRDEIPSGYRVAAWTEDGEVMAFTDEEGLVWGVQFHPESVLTPSGRTLLERFLTLTGEESRDGG